MKGERDSDEFLVAMRQSNKLRAFDTPPGGGDKERESKNEMVLETMAGRRLGADQPCCCCASRRPRDGVRPR